MLLFGFALIINRNYYLYLRALKCYDKYIHQEYIWFGSENMNKIFKNESSFLGKFESFCWKMWEKEPIRFLFVGGFNALISLILTYILRYSFDNFLQWNPKFVINENISLLSFDIPFIIAFVIGIPIAYSTQTLVAFRTKWSWVRLARYPLSSIPNFILQLAGICLFEAILSIPYVFSYVLAQFVALPIMFFIVKFLVKPIKLKSKKNEDNPSNEDLSK